MRGTRDGAIGRAEQYFDEGGFLAELQRRVAIPSTSQEQDSMPALQQYVSGEMTESLEKLGEMQVHQQADFLPARSFSPPAAILRRTRNWPNRCARWAGRLLSRTCR